MMWEAMAVYRERFRPSAQLAAPCVMLGVNVFAADTDAEARRLFSSLQQAFINLRRGRPGKLPAPVEGFTPDPAARNMLENALACSVVGGPEAIRQGLAEFAERTGADELMVTAQIHDPAARLRSFAITAEAAMLREAVATAGGNPG
jgi:alkanesulfonate monooxygenase SsuD/methylene tetrahydromethanopterin reductase-like flavin-dependent oxidoreductase (luciferase family)